MSYLWFVIWNKETICQTQFKWWALKQSKKRLWGWDGRWLCGEGVRFRSSWILSSPKTKTKTESESSDKTMKRVYDPDEDDHILRPKDKTKTETDPNVVVPCWICDANFKNDIALKININKLWKEWT